MVITATEGEELIKALSDKGIKATFIGKVTRSKRVLVSNGVELEVQESKNDELFSIK